MVSTRSKTRTRLAKATKVGKKHLRTVEPNAQQLFPGLPDEVSLEVIVPKLPWRALSVLASVSLHWRWAVQTRQVYNARLRSRSTETCVALVNDQRDIFLYSMRDNWFCQLPRVPKPPGVEPYDNYIENFQCLSLDGKLYVFGFGGGITQPTTEVEVHVLDLAAQQRQWEHCGSMQEERPGILRGEWVGSRIARGERVGYSATDRKFYILQPGYASKAYDPQSWTWSVRKSVSSERHFDYDVATVGEELLLYGGRTSDGLAYVDSIEVYNPVDDEWRVVGHFRRRHLIVESPKELFTAQGKIYAMGNASIDVHDSEKQSWRKLHSCLYPGMGRMDDLLVAPLKVQAVDDELFAIVQWLKLEDATAGSNLVRTRGLGGNKEQMVWDRVRLPGVWARPWAAAALVNSLLPIKL